MVFILLSSCIVKAIFRLCKVNLHVGQMPPAGRVPVSVWLMALSSQDGEAHSSEAGSKGAYIRRPFSVNFLPRTSEKVAMKLPPALHFLLFISTKRDEHNEICSRTHMYK